MTRHTTKIVYGYYTNRHGNEYRVITDQYSGGIYRVVDVYDDSMNHLIGKDLRNYHGFRKARKSELPQFIGGTFLGEVSFNGWAEEIA